jgi:predicted nucleic acid-binding protein
MTVLIDTGVLCADHDRDATRHDIASEALDAVYDGELGHPYISDYIFDEAITLTAARTGSHTAATALSQKLRGTESYPTVYELLDVSSAVFSDAVTVFERYDGQALSFTDATSIALVTRHGLDGILSFDDDFDGIVTRFEPAGV